MVLILSGEAPDPSLAELIDYSLRAAALQQGRPAIATAEPAVATAATWLPDGDMAAVDVDLWNIDCCDLDHPVMLSPLRDRDLKVLLEWFTPARIDDVEADIWQYLRRLIPEPCWEDDPFDFLQEYL